MIDTTNKDPACPHCGERYGASAEIEQWQSKHAATETNWSNEVLDLTAEIDRQQKFIDAVLPIIDVLAFDQTPRDAGLTYETLLEARRAVDSLPTKEPTNG